MKWSATILSLLISLTANSQTFKIQKSTNLADYNICQENHNRILKKFMNQADTQIARMINGIYSEMTLGKPEFKIEEYKNILNETVVKKIFYQELSKQLNGQSMAQPGKPTYYSNIRFLNPEGISVDLPTEYKKVIDEIVNAKNIRLAKDFLKDLRNSMIKDVAKKLVSKRFRKIGAGIFARIALGQTGQIATSTVLKSATISFGSELFISAGTGLIIDLLAFPLHAYRLPPETEWTNLLEDHPEVIIVPEWMNKAGIHDAPWPSHCYAIQRRTRYMEKSLSEALLTDEADFRANVMEIFELNDHEKDENENYYPASNVAVADNTYVYKPIVYSKSPGPLWLSTP